MRESGPAAPAAAAGWCVTLAAEDDVAGFRAAARRLVLQQVAPEQVSWRVDGAAGADLFDACVADVQPADPALAVEPLPEGVHSAQRQAQASAMLKVPGFFPPLCERAALHAAPERFALLYRLLWRLTHEPSLRHDPLDPDRLRAEQMARTVRREMHKMTAFVRFRPVSDAESRLHVAWYEPGHHITRATAPFFVRRFAQMRWAILTPACSARWDGIQLHFGPGAHREDAPPADAGEQLWLTYYEHIFNPARLKVAMMKKEMPPRYWRNLPEAALIQPLIRQAMERSGRMVESAPTEPAHRRPAASVALRLDQRPDRRADTPDEPGEI